MKPAKSISIVVLALFLSLSPASAQQIRWNADFQAYIDKYKDLAIEEMAQYRIPASITLAQGLLESGAGKSYLSRHGNNHFGIKSHGWEGRTIRHDDDARQEKFRAYDTVKESYEDHSRFLANRERYSRLFALKTTDYKGWARGLKECGYATNPQYAQRLIGIIETYKLYEYDTAQPHRHEVAKAEPQEPVKRKRPVAFHAINSYNQNFYIYTRQGDSFESIAHEMGLSASTLAKYNERDPRETLREGEVLYLRKKQKKADRKFKNHPHVVKAGESMYAIAQTYGMRLSSLYKLNHLPADYHPSVGDALRVY